MFKNIWFVYKFLLCLKHLLCVKYLLCKVAVARAWLSDERLGTCIHWTFGQSIWTILYFRAMSTFLLIINVWYYRCNLLSWDLNLFLFFYDINWIFVYTYASFAPILKNAPTESLQVYTVTQKRFTDIRVVRTLISLYFVSKYTLHLVFPEKYTKCF